MRVIQVPNSTAIQTVTEQDDNIVTITFTSGNSYNYTDLAGNFVDNVQNALDNDKSVGRLYNRTIKEDQTLKLIAN
jgi:hypothetical protein